MRSYVFFIGTVRGLNLATSSKVLQHGKGGEAAVLITVRLGVTDVCIF